MFGRTLLVAGTVALAAASFASVASADQCLGLDCPGVTPPSSEAHDPSIPVVDQPRDLESKRASGFYDFGTKGAPETRAVAYVVAPGDWAATPSEIKQLPAAQTLTATERSRNTIVFYGPQAMTTVPPATATAARYSKNKRPKARAAAFSDCPSGWFCLFDDYNGTGARGQWSSTGYWQNLIDFGWQSRGTSMNNRRNGWTLLERYDGARYCAIPNSQDGSLANNGFNNNTTRVYLSTSTTKQSAWNCSN